MSIALITTGGTIDKVYFDSKGGYEIGVPLAEHILHNGRVACDVDFIELFRKDSLNITDNDRSAIRDAVIGCTATRIIVTHGTDSMADTAKALIGVPRKTIVLTGAFQPARFSDSDAPFNLGMAVATVQVAPSGVYVVANGQVFRAPNLRKNVSRERFEKIED